MSVKERDPLTGHKTTGHEWNGITELNTRVPRAVWWAIGITHVWALVVWVLMPAWPLVTTYTRGLLGIDQRQLVAGEVEAGQRYRGFWVARLEGDSMDDIRADESLMEIVTGAAPRPLGRQLRLVPCGGRHRRTRIPEPCGRCLALGRQR
jgi:cytochrome c oxidase cbb3-type subunit III